MSSIPTTLGQYQIIREIARSNDIVYEAYDPLMNRRVAVKELAMPSGMTDAQKADRVSRFKREAQAAGTLNHSNIMTVYSFAEEAGRIFMALEFLDGHTLRNEIDTKGFVAPSRAIEIAIDVLEGLGHAHSKGVIHRDIKPDNIQILSSGQVKITDFGIARLTFQPNLTMDGQVFGTPSYMSPEQVVGREIDARSDLFSVAVVLYEMIAGQKPFAGDSVVTITYAIMNKEPQQPAQCTWSLWQVLSRALDKSPQLRYANASEMIEALREAERQSKSGTMGSSSSPYPNAPPQSTQTGAYSHNPYAPNPPGAPLPPPQLSPYAQPPSPYPTAYNPYQAQPPVIQPGQYPQGQYPQGQYPQAQYQPYGAQPPSVMPYSQMPSMPPPGPLPVYYPPPPRAPFLKPETVFVIRKFLLFLAIFGAIVALLFAVMRGMVQAYEEGNAAERDTQIAGQIAALDKKEPVSERVERAKQMMAGLPADHRTSSNQQTAVLDEELGNEYLRKGDPTHAENYFVDGARLDPYSAAIQTDLGSLYDELAQNSSQDPQEQVDNYKHSGDAWEQASHLERDKSRSVTYADHSAQAYYRAASMAMQQANPDGQSVRYILYQAREIAPANSNIRSLVSQSLTQLEGR